MDADTISCHLCLQAYLSGFKPCSEATSPLFSWMPHSSTRFITSLSMFPECSPHVSLLLNLPLDRHTVSFSRTEVEFISVSLDNVREAQCISYYNIRWILLQIIISSRVQNVLLPMHIERAWSPDMQNACFYSMPSPHTLGLFCFNIIFSFKISAVFSY